MGANAASEFPVPVVGGSGTSVPTSGDVHLYADPESYYAQFPRLYADCEGLLGGEKIPIANRVKGTDNPFGDPKKRFDAHGESGHANRVRKKARGAKRALKWATAGETSKREFAVRELYPRILYTFSDVVVFVLHNERYVRT